MQITPTSPVVPRATVKFTSPSVRDKKVHCALAHYHINVCSCFFYFIYFPSDNEREWTDDQCPLLYSAILCSTLLYSVYSVYSAIADLLFLYARNNNNKRRRVQVC